MTSDKTSELRNVWDVELEILDIIHNVCVENNLKYSLSYGSLLGAVRHGGFIPWDDDLDIMMPRKDYDKFIEIWPTYSYTDYILQNIETDPDFTQNFTKIRKNNTTFLQLEEEKFKKYHTGIYVDIFPADKLPKSRLLQMFQFACIAVSLLYSRKFLSPRKGLIERILLLFPDKFKNFTRRIMEKIIRIWNRDDSLEYIFTGTIDDPKIHLPNTLFDDMTEMDFEDRKYFSIKDYKYYLTMFYGDYMEFPPESERTWKHHPILIDLEHNYEDIKDEI